MVSALHAFALGGDREDEEFLKTNPKLSAHISVFDESIAQTECLRWLRELRFKQLEEKPEGDFLNVIKAFVNQTDFLPNDVRMEKSSPSCVNAQ